MTKKRYVSKEDWDDYLDLSDSHSKEFSDLFDSENKILARNQLCFC